MDQFFGIPATKKTNSMKTLTKILNLLYWPKYSALYKLWFLFSTDFIIRFVIVLLENLLFAEVVAAGLSPESVVVSIAASIIKFLTFSRFRIEEEAVNPGFTISWSGRQGADNGRIA
jgi:hypothetical protein